ncbi:hypothetical protein Tco_1085696, partial [Tanacetum coccineum]
LSRKEEEIRLDVEREVERRRRERERKIRLLRENENNQPFSLCGEGYVETEFPAIAFNDTLISEDYTDNDDDKIDIEHSSGDLSVKPLPDVINTDVGAYAHVSHPQTGPGRNTCPRA